MNKMEASLPSDWMIIARKDWNRIHQMLEYDVGNLGLRYLDIEKGLSEAKLFIKAMFPYEKIK